MANVLVVDDSTTFRRILCSMLQSVSYVISEATNGEEALDALKASPTPLVVVLDVVMPKLGGIGVLTAVDADPALASRHAFILVTATPDAIPPSAVAEMLTRLRVPLLVKPFAAEQLLALIARAKQQLAAAGA
jgi:CheY-like chemotaxis protein